MGYAKAGQAGVQHTRRINSIARGVLLQRMPGVIAATSRRAPCPARGA